MTTSFDFASKVSVILHRNQKEHKNETYSKYIMAGKYEI